METLLLLSRVSIRGILTDVHNEIARTQVEAPNSTNTEIGSSEPSNTEIGSSEPEGVERKDATRRLMRAREPGHLMSLSRSHLTRQSREA